jgi:uncharacterized protein
MTELTLSEANDVPPFEALHPQARWFMRAGSAFGLALPLAGACFVLTLLLSTRLDFDRGATLAAVLPLALLVSLPFGWWHGGAAWRRTRFRLDAHGLEIHRGVFWRHEIRVPRSRVQHTDVACGPIDRQLGLATLKVFTAGTRMASVDLDGLPAARAAELRAALLDSHDDAV